MWCCCCCGRGARGAAVGLALYQSMQQAQEGKEHHRVLHGRTLQSPAQLLTRREDRTRLGEPCGLATCEAGAFEIACAMEHDRRLLTASRRAAQEEGVRYPGSQQAAGNGGQQVQEHSWLLEVNSGPDDEGHCLLYSCSRCSLQPACRYEWSICNE